MKSWPMSLRSRLHASKLAAVRHSLRHQGQHRFGGNCHDRRLPGVRLHAAAIGIRSSRSLVDAGAIPSGKTNLDQFATGLVGTRSPYGACRNSFNAEYISGGSSSGSAVAVAAGVASFSLGTDTAGSGRVPAAFNNIVGLKPSNGRLSTRGVVPACRSLDCVSVFALTPEDAAAVLDVAEGYDAEDPYSRNVDDRGWGDRGLTGLRVGDPAARPIAIFRRRGIRAAVRCRRSPPGEPRRRDQGNRLRAVSRGGASAVRGAVDCRAVCGGGRVHRSALRGGASHHAPDHRGRQAPDCRSGVCGRVHAARNYCGRPKRCGLTWTSWRRRPPARFTGSPNSRRIPCD